ncbi:MAG: mannose-1-phosphate guanylyltransferase/mannose-6-phosphate isomerase, partial [Deltaproteobacteria bacterium]|nr:mannose-1-phosphate guanylyltransferase/mannose-6-phosphate isomerase [Deltaproteobacteria bacterium]
NFYGVILAGGVGSRFWPLSRESAPKQVLKVAGEESLLLQTIERLKPLIPPSRIYIVTSAAQAEIIKHHLDASGLKELPSVIAEPEGRNTAPAIGLAAAELLKKDKDAVMAVLPSDNIIGDVKRFRETLAAAHELATNDNLVTFGVKPSRPETGFGYIKVTGRVKKVNELKSWKVGRFVEKPVLSKAKLYLKDKAYYWNSGIFVWRVEKLLSEMGKHLPGVAVPLGRYLDGAELKKIYKTIESISIDHGVLERSKDVMVIEADYPWSDMGAWSSLKDVFKPDKNGNIIKGRVVDIDSKGSYLIGSDRVLATIGLNDLVVVDTPDATLVCSKERAQEVKEVVNVLKKKGYEEHATHVTIDRPWGSYTVLEKGSSYKIKRINVLPGKRLSLQSHKKRSEHWVVVSGTAEVVTGKKKFRIKKNESTYIPKHVKHRLCNPSKKVLLEIIEVQNGSYVEEDDIVRYDDDYSRC